MTDVGHAAQLYARFHDKPPHKMTALPSNVRMPTALGVIGRALAVLYRSAKWSRTGTPTDYIHRYESDVLFCEPWRLGLPRLAALEWPSAVVYLGRCLGVAVLDPGGEVISPALERGTQLVATPDGTALALLSPRDGVVGVLVGGRQIVGERGIEG